MEESLELLSAIVKRSRSKALRRAFVNYLDALNTSMQDYVTYLELLQGTQSEPGVHDYVVRK